MSNQKIINTLLGGGVLSLLIFNFNIGQVMSYSKDKIKKEKIVSLYNSKCILLDKTNSINCKKIEKDISYLTNIIENEQNIVVSSYHTISSTFKKDL